MAGSAQWAALTAVHAILSGDATVAANAAVYDGPVPTDSPDPVVVVVGDNGDPETDEAAVSGTQTWAGLGARARDEEFTVRCAVVARAGDFDYPALRAQARTVLDACEAALRANTTLNGAVTWASYTDGELYQAATDAGARIRITFGVSCRARI